MQAVPAVAGSFVGPLVYYVDKKTKLLLERSENARIAIMSFNTLTERQYLSWQRRMAFFRKIFHCHQLSSRSFFYKGMQLPLCARCSGILLGLVVGIVPCIFSWYHPLLSAGLILIMFVDGFTQLKKWRESNNILRLLTGIGFGYSMMSFLFILTKLIITAF